MKDNISFLKCEICGNIIELVDGNVANIKCCGREMKELKANTMDAAIEKHVPIYEQVEDELIVKVGEVEHPMDKEHYIMWTALVTDNKIMRTTLYPEQNTETRFPYIKGATIYAYCNKHGLWKNTID